MKLRWTDLSRKDRDLIYDYVATDHATAAIMLDERFEHRSKTLIELPLLGRVGRVPGTRELVVPGTSYLLIYKVTDDAVWILRVIHTAKLWPDT